ncbi:MAG: nucleotide-binding protein, partial [Acidimicrobiia bacterium]|nr:nucleotide-binding protein [Acidimicrobiia bacterium]
MSDARRDETLGGFIVHGIPFPIETDPDALAFLKRMTPIQIEQEYSITYLHSYGQDSPWFAGASNKKLLASQDADSGYTYATPRGHDMYSGRETDWIDITDRAARVHAFTVCFFGSEEFLPDTPFILALIEYEGVNT